MTQRRRTSRVLAVSIESLERRNLFADLTGSHTFRPVDVGAGGYVTGIITHPLNASIRYARTDVGNAYRWDTSTNRWEPLKVRDVIAGTGLPADLAAVPASGGVNSIAVDPNNTSTLYAAFPLPRSTAVSGTNPSVLTNIYRSNDGGRTFTVRANLSLDDNPNDAFRDRGERLRVDPNNANVVYYGSSKEGLFRSIDGGATFTNVPTPAGATNVLNVLPVRSLGTTNVSGQPATSNLYISLASGDVLFSPNAGQNWTNLTDGVTGLDNGAAVITLAPDNSLLAPVDRNVWKYSGGVWTSVDGGIGSIRNIAIDPVVPSRWFAVSVGGALSRSTNSGQSWQTLFDAQLFANTLGWLPQSINGSTSAFRLTSALTIDANSRLWISQGNEGVLSYLPSPNNSESFQNPPRFTIESAGIEEFVGHQIAILPGSGDRVIGTVEDATGFVITNPDNFTARQIPLQDQLISNGNSVAYVPNDPRTIVVASSDPNFTGSGRNYSGYSTDGGLTWQPFGPFPAGVQTGSIAVSARGNWTVGNDHIVYLPIQGRVPLYSKDGGKTWSQSTGLTDGGLYFLSLKQFTLQADPFVPDKFYLKTTYGDFYVSTNGGESWTSIYTALPVGTFHSQLATNRALQNDLYFVAGVEGPFGGSFSSPFGLFHSTTGGTSWSRLAGVEQAYTVAVGVGPTGPGSSSVYIYGKLEGDPNYGVFRSDNAGTTWDRLSYYPAGNIDRVNSISASWDTYGLVYLTTEGNSFLYGRPNTFVAPTPAAPSSLTATYTPGTGTQLSWTDNSTNEQNFLIQRSTSPDFSQRLSTFETAWNTTTFTDRNLDPATRFYYRVLSQNAGNNSAATNSVSIVSSPFSSRLFRGSVVTNTDNVNLTTVGTADWVHFGDTDGNVNAVTRKNGGSGISPVTILGTGQFGTDTGTYARRPVSWTDGPASFPTATGNLRRIYQQGADAGFSFSVPADRFQRTVTVLVSTEFARGQFRAHLSTDSDASNDYVYLAPDNAGEQAITLTYAAPSDGATLTLSWINTPSPNYILTLTAVALSGSAPFLSAPTSLTATTPPTPSANPPVTLAWAAATTGSAAAAYSIFRSTTPNDPNPSLLATTPNTTYVDSATAPATTYYYTVRATNDTLVSPTSNTATVSTPALAISLFTNFTNVGPSPLPLTGSASFNATLRQYTITAAGADPSNRSDRLGFNWTTVSGDQTISAQVLSITNTNPGVRAGIMFRTSTADNAPFVSISITPSQGAIFRWRTTAGGGTSSTTRAGVVAGQYIRLVRTADSVRAYTSPNGTTWTTLGNAIKFNPSTPYLAGLAVTSRSNTTASTGVFANVSLSTAPLSAMSTRFRRTEGDFQGALRFPESISSPATASYRPFFSSLPISSAIRLAQEEPEQAPQ